MKHIPNYSGFILNEGKDDYIARYGKTDILIKKGYKVADETVARFKDEFNCG